MVLPINKKEVGSPRPIYDETKKPISGKRFERLEMGTRTSGVVVDATRKGVEIRGYYRSQGNADIVYSTLRKPVFIPWEELEKIRESVMKPASKVRKPNKKGKEKQAFTDFDMDLKYLEALPKVELNGKYYYIDSERRERRSVDNPQQVVKY